MRRITKSRKLMSGLEQTAATSRSSNCRLTGPNSTQPNGFGTTLANTPLTIVTSNSRHNFAKLFSERSARCNGIPKKLLACYRHLSNYDVELLMRGYIGNGGTVFKMN